MPYPEQDDYFNVEDFQDMMVSVDNLMKKLSDSGAQISSDAEHLYNQTKAQMDNIQKRMNAFTALRDGSTTGDAELKDIRVAYDGKEYGNAGEAVREQASDIHKALFGNGVSIWSKTMSQSTKYVTAKRGIFILNEPFVADGVITKINRGTFRLNETKLGLDKVSTAYIVKFENTSGTMNVPSLENLKGVSACSIKFEEDGNAHCWIPVEKGQYLAVTSTVTAYETEDSKVPYMFWNQEQKTMEYCGFTPASSTQPAEPHSLALEYKLEYDMDDAGLVKQVAANRETAALLKEELSESMADIRTFGEVNYLNLENLAKGKAINANGELVDSGNSAETTVFIPVSAGDYHYVNDANAKFSVVSFFDSTKTFISRVTVTNEFTVANGTSFIRVTSGSAGFPNHSMIYKGTEKPVYEPYYKANNLVMTGDNIKNGSVTLSKTSGLFPMTNIIPYPSEKKNGYYNFSGLYVDSSDLECKIYPVEYDGQNFYYTGALLGSAKVAMATYLDINKHSISNNGEISDSTKHIFNRKVVIPPKEAKYVAFSAYIRNNDFFCIETEKRIYETKNHSSADMFIGHNKLPKFDTDYCSIICYGQSLSNGSDSLFVTDEALDGNLTFGTIDNPSTTMQALKLKTGQQHPIVSAINSLSKLIRDNGNITCKFVGGSYGSGGQSIAQLMSANRQAEIKAEDGYSYNIDTNGKYNTFLNALNIGKQIADANDQTISCPVIVFLQGERDYYSDEKLSGQSGSTTHAYACGGNKNKYKLYMNRLKEDMQNACISAYGQSVKPLFCIYQCSGNFVKDHTLSINMAQVEFAEENDDVILLPSPYFTPNYSSAHLTTNGYRWYGEYIAKAIYQTLVLRSEYRPMQISGAIVEGKNVRVKICNADLPVVFDNYTVEQASGYGFAIWADESRISPYKIKIYGDEIIIFTNTDLSSATKVELSYGGMENGGTGNIRDSSAYKAKYNYWDDSSDTGTSGTLTISHSVKDKDGNSIIGKKYPMWNWLASWYGLVNR